MGGGHAHVQVLRAFAMRPPPPDVRVLLVVDRAEAIYSGMVPGFVAGDYEQAELTIDVWPLARRAGTGVIRAAALDLDPVAHTITLEGRPPLHYDVASLDTGSSVRGLDVPGVREHALATRPIGDFVRALDARADALAALGRPVRVEVVGGGAAGTELAFTLEARLAERGVAASVGLVSADREPLGDARPLARRAVLREARARGLALRLASRVVAVDATGLTLVSATGDETYRPADLVVWATGAAPGAFPRGGGTSRLPIDAHGFLEVRDTLQTTGFDDVFAAGDCARLVDHRWVPRAGVYAVRQGPVLERNLRARLEGRALERYRPQRDFLALLHLGHGRALATKWGLVARGRLPLVLKDRIDRRFMARFQVLRPDGRPRPALARLGGMRAMEPKGVSQRGGPHDDAASAAGHEHAALLDGPPCGGCAAKLGARPLAAALDALPEAPADDSIVLGVAQRDDVAATRLADGRIQLHNVDVIRAFCDDPWLVARVAACNATSDLYARGGRPRHAQAIIGLPDTRHADASRELLFQVLSGLRSVLDPLGTSLLGGHTTIGEALWVGLSITGDGPDAKHLTATRARAGDVLLLSRPLGTGVVLAADMRGLAPAAWVEATLEAMQRPNAIGERLATLDAVHAMTDVTGFGLAGHLAGLLDRAELVASLERHAIPLLPGAATLFSEGLRSTAHPANRTAFTSRLRGASDADCAWLFDPQTAGGLLLAVDPAEEARVHAVFAQAGEHAPARIGQLRAGPHAGAIEVVEG
ncbi:MAG: selenide, water dikinase SelD [Spirochaetaceae bacterium]|nr:selenide, water dikinase SelD [Spirochaetaceae bacterium]